MSLLIDNKQATVGVENTQCALPGSRPLLKTGCNSCGQRGKQTHNLEILPGVEIRRKKRAPFSDASSPFAEKAALLFQLHGSGAWDYMNAFVTSVQEIRPRAEASAYLSSSLQNQRDIGMHFGSQELSQLLIEHIQGAGAVLSALRGVLVLRIDLRSSLIKAWINKGRFDGSSRNRTQSSVLTSLRGNAAAVQALLETRDAIISWYDNADDIASFANDLDSRQLPFETVAELMYTHLRQFLVMAAHLINQEYSQALDVRGKYLQHIVAIGKALAAAVEK